MNSSRIALVAGVVFLAIGMAVALLAPAAIQATFLRAYLAAYVLCLALSIGSLGLWLIGEMSGGEWALPIVRIFQAGSGPRNWILLAVLFLPIAIGARSVFPWTAPGQQTWYNNLPFFWLRAVIYFLFWGMLATTLRRWSISAAPSFRRSNLAAPSLFFLFLTGSFASFDWLMSLEQEWSSTIFGFLFLLTCAMGAMGHVLTYVDVNRRNQPYVRLLNPALSRDFGNLTLTILLLWAYMNYSQYIIVWSGNLPNEAQYYVHRTGPIWNLWALGLTVLGFFVPLFALTSSRVKSDIHTLGWVAKLLLLVAWADLIWMSVPPLIGDSPMIWVGCFALAFAGTGLLWRWAFLATIAEAPLVPEEDPRIRRVLDHAAA